MNKEEKNYLFDKCNEYYLIALEKIPFDCDFIASLAKARELKSFIERFLDCQSSPYYERYLRLVSLENQFKVR